jgi:hypothetical protein
MTFFSRHALQRAEIWSKVSAQDVGGQRNKFVVLAD